MSRLIGDAPFSDEERALLLVEARKLIGMPWRHQGRTENGSDCVGFLWLPAAKVRDIPKPHVHYGRLPNTKQKLRAGIIEYLGEPVDRDPIPFDVVTLEWTAGEQHVALVTPHPHYGIGLLHCDNHAPGPKGPRVVEHGADAHWVNRIAEVWRL